MLAIMVELGTQMGTAAVISVLAIGLVKLAEKRNGNGKGTNGVNGRDGRNGAPGPTSGFDPALCSKRGERLTRVETTTEIELRNVNEQLKEIFKKLDSQQK